MPPPQMLSKSRVHPPIKAERFSGKRFALKHLQQFLVAHCSLLSPSLNFTVVNPFLSLSFGNNSTWEGERSIFHSSLECSSQWEEQNGRTAVKGFNKWLFCSNHWVLHLKSCTWAAAPTIALNFIEQHFASAFKPLQPWNTSLGPWSRVFSLPGEHLWNCSLARKNKKMGHLLTLSVLEGMHKPTATWKDGTKYVRTKYSTETQIIVFFYRREQVVLLIQPKLTHVQ